MSELVVKPLTPDLWPALESLFGEKGASNGCWCMYWRIGGTYTKRSRGRNKADLRAIVKRGPPPGLLAFDGDLAVGWCQLTPRADLPALERGRFTKAVDDVPVLALSCFYVRAGHRKKGVTTALIAAALKQARHAKVRAVEAYPVDADGSRSTSGMYTGRASTFARAGFKVVARPAPHRPTMRYDLKAAAR